MSIHIGVLNPEGKVRFALEAIERTVIPELQTRVDARQPFSEQVELANNAPVWMRMADGVGAQSSSKAVSDWIEGQRLQVGKPTIHSSSEHMRTLSLVTNGGVTVSVPPYDLEWVSSNPALDTGADKTAGRIVTRSLSSGYQAAALGVFVSTTVSGNFTFSADAEFRTQWNDIVAQGAATTEGGVGVLAYEGGNVIARSDAQLWSDFQSGNSLQEASGDFTTLLEQTSAAQTSFHMLPGRQYLLWVWCWTTAVVRGNDLAFASIDATIPFVVIHQQ